MTDTRNVLDKYKGWTEELIQADVLGNTFDYRVCMFQLQGDFNIGTVIRNANAFGASTVFYVGNKKWDRRGTVGTHNYTNVIHREWTDLIQYTASPLVAVEITDDAVPLPEFEWPDRPIMVFGEENYGIPPKYLDDCQYKVKIPMYGSVRSLNAGVASGIAMNDYVTKYLRKNND